MDQVLFKFIFTLVIGSLSLMVCLVRSSCCLCSQSVRKNFLVNGNPTKCFFFIRLFETSLTIFGTWGCADRKNERFSGLWRILAVWVLSNGKSNSWVWHWALFQLPFFYFIRECEVCMLCLIGMKGCGLIFQLPWGSVCLFFYGGGGGEYFGFENSAPWWGSRVC